MCLHRRLKVVPPVYPVLLCISPLAWALLGPLHWWYSTGVSDANRLDRYSVTGASGATVTAELVQFNVTLSFFLRVLFCLAFFLHPLDLLMFT